MKKSDFPKPKFKDIDLAATRSPSSVKSEEDFLKRPHTPTAREMLINIVLKRNQPKDWDENVKKLSIDRIVMNDLEVSFRRRKVIAPHETDEDVIVRFESINSYAGISVYSYGCELKVAQQLIDKDEHREILQTVMSSRDPLIPAYTTTAIVKRGLAELKAAQARERNNPSSSPAAAAQGQRPTTRKTPTSTCTLL